MSQAVETVTAFLRQLFDARVDPSSLRDLLHPQVEFVERPSKMAPTGHRRGLDAALAGAATGHAIMAFQRFDIDDIREAGDTVVVRGAWTGTTARDLPGMAAGTTLRAHVASFWQLEAGRIRRVTSYDCYEQPEQPSSTLGPR